MAANSTAALGLGLGGLASLSSVGGLARRGGSDIKDNKCAFFQIYFQIEEALLLSNLALFQRDRHYEAVLTLRRPKNDTILFFKILQKKFPGLKKEGPSCTTLGGRSLQNSCGIGCLGIRIGNLRFHLGIQWRHIYIYSELSNKHAANLILFEKFFPPTYLIRTYTFIYLW